jgi:flagellar export protein FliJ
MKKYKFPFEKVLKIKSIELDRYVIQLNEIRYEIVQVEEKICILTAQQSTLNETYLIKISNHLTSFELRQMQYQKESLKIQIKQLDKKLVELKRNENVALERVIEKKKEQNTLNKLDEKQFNEYTEFVHKKESALLDEMVLLKLHQKKG